MRSKRAPVEDAGFGGGVYPTWDLLDLERRTCLGVAFAGDVDTKVAHEGDGHVDVELGDDGFSGEDGVVSCWAYGAQRRMEDTYCDGMEASRERVPPGRPVRAMERGGNGMCRGSRCLRRP